MGLSSRPSPALPRALAPVLALALAAGCSTGDGADRQEAQSSAQQAAAERVPAERAAGAPASAVVLISIDGLNPAAIARLGSRRAPHLTRLLKTGTGTRNARTAREATTTLPNHTGILTGRRVRASKGGHGVWRNKESALPRTVHESAGERVSSVFDVVHRSGGSTIMYTSKSKFRFFERSWDDALDRTVVDSDTDLVRRLRKDLRNGPRTWTFLHLSAPDKVGHAHGFMGPEYLAAVRRTDARLGKLFRTVKRAKATRGRTAVVLTSDHGGSGSGHHQRERYANHRVLLVARGPGVKRGGSLYGLNRHANPGRTHPAYGARKPALRNLAAGNLALQLIGRGAVPGSMPESRGLRTR